MLGSLLSLMYKKKMQLQNGSPVLNSRFVVLLQIIFGCICCNSKLNSTSLQTEKGILASKKKI